jgi:hypothetical protein
VEGCGQLHKQDNLLLGNSLEGWVAYRSRSRSSDITKISIYYWVSGLCPQCGVPNRTQHFRKWTFMSSAEKELVSVTGHWLQRLRLAQCRNKKKRDKNL